MSSRDSQVSLPPHVEQLLGSWPAPERSEEFWEQMASSTQVRVSLAKPGSTPDTLLAAPLPAEAGEGTLGDSSRRLKARASRPDATPLPVGSLAQLARASLAQNGHDAATKEIAAASLSLSSQTRHEAPRLAEAMRAQAASRPSIPEVTPLPAAPPAAAPAKKQRRLAFIGAAGALALAAAAALLLGRPRAGGDIVAAQAPAPAAPVQAAQPAPVPAPQAAPAPDPAEGVTFEELPPERRVTASSERAGAAPRASSATASASRQPVAAGAQPAPAAKAVDDLPPNPNLAPAYSENRQTRPSTGAVMAAVGAVMGGARACVAGQQTPSRATVTFGSDGRVQSVAVSGPAAGTPAEGCVKSALSGARVQPFAESTFSIAVPVRP